MAQNTLNEAPSDSMDKPTSQACLRNQEPIYQALAPFMSIKGTCLELASGTGQHGVYLAEHLPHIQWHLSEVHEQCTLSAAWLQDAGLSNVKPAIALDVSCAPWPLSPHSFDYGFCANLLHFVSQEDVQNVFSGMARALKSGGVFFCYGPINENGFTSEGNAALDHWLKTDINPKAGIKERDWLINLAQASGFEFNERLNLPANNVILVFKNIG